MTATLYRVWPTAAMTFSLLLYTLAAMSPLPGLVPRGTQLLGVGLLAIAIVVARHRSRVPRGDAEVAWAALASLVLVSSSWAARFQGSALRGAWFCVASGGLLMAGREAARRDREMAFVPILAVFVIVLTSALRRLATGDLAYAEGFRFRAAEGMFSGGLHSANLLGAALMLCVPAVLAAGLRARSSAALALAGLTTAAGVAVVAVSAARAAFVGSVAIVLAAYLAFARERGRLGRATLAALVAITAIAWRLPPGSLAGYFDKYRVGVLASHASLWDEAIRMASSAGWIGGGFGASVGNTPGGLVGVSSYLALIVDLGWLGATAAVIALGALLIDPVRTAWRGQPGMPRASCVVLVAGMVAALAHATFETWMNDPGRIEFALFWSLCGLAAALAETTETRA